MKPENILLEKTYAFSIKIIELYKALNFENKEFDLAKQVLRSGTSIGANSEEAIGGQSKKDFISKLSIALKEARETHYWIRILRDTNFIETSYANELKSDCEEVIRILTSILKTSKNTI